MKKLNQGGALDATLALAIVIIVAVGGFVVYRISSESSDEVASNTSTESSAEGAESKTNNGESGVDEAEETEAAFTYEGAVVESGNRGFSITIPDGWTVNSLAGSNNINAVSLEAVTYEEGTPAEVLEVSGGTDSNHRFTVIQLQDGQEYVFSASNSEQTSTEFKTSTLSGTKHYVQYPVEPVDGIGPYPGQESYVYEFTDGEVKTYVIYNVLNANEYSTGILSSLTSDDPNQEELVDAIVNTLVINN